VVFAGLDGRIGVTEGDTLFCSVRWMKAWEEKIDHWSLTNSQQRPAKTGRRLIVEQGGISERDRGRSTHNHLED
jgi:hypothetical protein